MNTKTLWIIFIGLILTAAVSAAADLRIGGEIGFFYYLAAFSGLGLVPVGYLLKKNSEEE